MINSVRSTVLAVLNKNNYGYLSPSDFNLFAKQAQLDIFQGYFQKYNDQVTKENLRQSGTEYANIKEKIETQIDNFLVTNSLTIVESSKNKFKLPSLATTGDELFKIEKVLCYDFISETKTYRGQAEKITKSKVTALNVSAHTAPTKMFPVYVLEGTYMYVYPDTFNVQNSIECSYVRLPKAPKWTYVSLSGGEPVFNASAGDYQDFEVSPFEEVNLIVKILEYAGISIRESDVYTFAKTQEQIQTAK